MLLKLAVVVAALAAVVVAAMVLPPLTLAVLIALIGLAFSLSGAWEVGVIFAVIALICVVLWRIEQHQFTQPVLRIPVGSTQPKAKELVMIPGSLYTLAAAMINFACCVVLFQMYYLGVTERVIGGVAWSYFMFATPVVLVIAIINNQSAKHRSGLPFWRTVDGISSATLMVFVWITAILSSFVIGLPTSVPTPVLTSYTALVLIWTLAIWTLYDVFSNQRRNMYELLAKYPNARVIFSPQPGTDPVQDAAGEGVSVSLADAIDSGSRHVVDAVPRRGEIPVDFHIVPYLVMPNGDRVRLRRVPDMIDVTPGAVPQDTAQQGHAPAAPAGDHPPLN